MKFKGKLEADLQYKETNLPIFKNTHYHFLEMLEVILLLFKGKSVELSIEKDKIKIKDDGYEYEMCNGEVFSEIEHCPSDIPVVKSKNGNIIDINEEIWNIFSNGDGMRFTIDKDGMTIEKT